MEEQKRRILGLIVLRFALLSCVLGLTRFALTGREALATDYVFPVFLALAVLTAVYLLLWKFGERLVVLYWIQFAADLVLISLLLLFSGGVDSIFTPFYVLIIVYSSFFQGRFGGVLALLVCIPSYIAVVHLNYLEVFPFSKPLVNYEDVVFEIAVNLLGLVSVAFLGITLSERLQSAREELGAAKILQENIIGSIRSGLATADLAQCVTFINAVGGRMLGLDTAKLIGRRLGEIFSDEVERQIKASDFRSSSRALRIEHWIDTREGRRLYLGFGCSPLLDDNEDTIGYVLSFQDLTEIKKREEEFQFKEKMAAIGRMAAGLAHELRNPLGSLSGSIQILRSELDLDKDQSRLLEIVLRESERLNRIVSDFLTYAGPQPTVFQPVELNKLVTDTLHLFQNSLEFDAEKHSLAVESQTNEIRCLGNPDQLRQVVWNILQNGIRAMPEGGELSIQLEHRAGATLLCFKDEGIGMTKAEQETLFQPFQSGFRKGAGLGMAIVYQIIQQHRGRIEVQSSQYQGTRIDLYLPEGTSA